MKVLKVKNNYSDCPKTYYDWSDPNFYRQTIIDEVEANLDAGASIELKFEEMSQKKFDNIPVIE